MEQLSFFDHILDMDDNPFDNPQDTIWFKKQNRISIPIELVSDFDQFMDYLCHHSIQLTNTKSHISRKHLPSINERLTIKAEEATDYTQQEYYPYIHFFYHIALAGQLIQLESFDSTKLQLTVTERWNLYNNLTDTEKYFFLLETFWIDVNWAKILDKKDNPVHIVIEDVFSKLLDTKSNNCLKLNDSLISRLTFHWDYFFVYLEWFGFWVCEKDHQAMDRYHSNKKFIAKSVTLTTFGKQMIPILLNNRHPQIWNIPYRRENGEVNPIPGLENDGIENFFGKQMNKRKDQSFQPFYKSFDSLFIKIVLRKTLPRQERIFTPGMYTFKVAYDKYSWCKVALTAQHTMEDLHKIIINTFQFDNDYLYSFFMDGIKGSKSSIVAPLDNSSSPIASNVLIGSVGLSVGQRFLYLFDHVSERTFTITVEQIAETGSEKERPKPYLIEHQGKGPEQYFYNEKF
ncbi:IS1096 element passenger TnpR family protein [Pseudogracilibacillus sp. SO30301A]|uniref:IS1096 element passenger TnpR family protein n=1 Tax=Pseudogracilibacillus sp. SO30301A TaxID=3098291 RepID=UPI00300E0A6B